MCIKSSFKRGMALVCFVVLYKRDVDLKSPGGFKGEENNSFEINYRTQFHNDLYPN